MTISSTVRRAGPFEGNGVTTAFPFTFRVFTESDVSVTLTDADGVESLLVLDSDYSVQLDPLGGGEITYPLTGDPLDAGLKITITGGLEYDQPTDIRNQGGFYPQVIEDSLDRLTIQTQQLAEMAGRAVKAPISSSIDPDALINQLTEDAATAAHAAEDAEDARDIAVGAANTATQKAGIATAAATTATNASGAAQGYANNAAQSVQDMEQAVQALNVSSAEIRDVAFAIDEVEAVADALPVLKAAPEHASQARDNAILAEQSAQQAASYAGVAGGAAQAAATSAGKAEASAQSVQHNATLLTGYLTDRDMGLSFFDEPASDPEDDGAIRQLQTDMRAVQEDVATLQAGTVRVLPSSTISLPAPASLVYFNFDTDATLPTSKGPEIPGAFALHIDGLVVRGYASMEVQGASSAGYPKKNWKLKFYSDAALSKKLYLQIDGMPPTNKWTYKANWIDATHVRNILCNRLWELMVQTRQGWPKREVDIPLAGVNTSPAGNLTGALGHVNGWPCVFNVNGAFYGIGDWNYDKDNANYNIDDSNPRHYHLEKDNHADLTVMVAGTDLDINSPDVTWGSTQEADLDRLRNLAGMDQTAFNAAAPGIIDKQNVIDYLILLECVYAPDATMKNFRLVSWGGQKWYFLPYDLDTTFGLHWNGGSLYPGSESATLVSKSSGWYGRIWGAWPADIQARYKALRDAGVLSVDTIYRLAQPLSEPLYPKLMAAEFSKWPTVPSKGITSVAQILAWMQQRLVHTDSYFSYP